MGDTIRDDINETMAEALETTSSEAPEPVDAPEPPPDSGDVDPVTGKGPHGEEKPVKPSGDRVRGPDGKFAKTGDEPAERPVKPAVRPAPADHAPDPAKLPAPGAPSAPTLKAPASWRPAEREAWAKVPPEAQSAIERREKEMDLAFKQLAPARDFAQRWQQLVGPFVPMMRAEGATPEAAVQSLLHTAQALRTAPLPTRAKMIADIVKQHGIPIELLDKALAGEELPQGGVDPAALERQITERIMSQFGQQQQQSMAQYGTSVVDRWVAEKQPEFYEDVREDMSILMRSKQGMDLDKAYETACRMNPDVREHIERRAEAEKRKKATEVAEKARKAGGSPRPESQGPTGGSEDDESLRDTIRGAFRVDRV